MKTKLNPLITALYSGSISQDEFIKEYFLNTPRSDEHVLNLINSGILHKDTIAVEEAIVLLYTGFFSNKLFTAKLCELLQSDWHTKHEDIAMLLKDIEDPSTVDCLYHAVESKLDYLDYDDTYQFARKCIKALSAIGDDNAIDKLRILTSSKIGEIAAYAKKELYYKGML